MKTPGLETAPGGRPDEGHSLFRRAFEETYEDRAVLEGLTVRKDTTTTPHVPIPTPGASEAEIAACEKPVAGRPEKTKKLLKDDKRYQARLRRERAKIWWWDRLKKFKALDKRHLKPADESLDIQEPYKVHSLFKRGHPSHDAPLSNEDTGISNLEDGLPLPGLPGAERVTYKGVEAEKAKEEKRRWQELQSSRESMRQARGVRKRTTEWRRDQWKKQHAAPEDRVLDKRSVELTDVNSHPHVPHDGGPNGAHSLLERTRERNLRPGNPRLKTYSGSGGLATNDLRTQAVHISPEEIEQRRKQRAKERRAERRREQWNSLLKKLRGAPKEKPLGKRHLLVPYSARLSRRDPDPGPPDVTFPNKDIKNVRHEDRPPAPATCSGSGTCAAEQPAWERHLAEKPEDSKRRLAKQAKEQERWWQAPSRERNRRTGGGIDG